MEETTEKRPVSYTRRAFYWFLAPLGVLVLFGALGVLLFQHQDIVILLSGFCSLSAALCCVQCIRYADKALEAGETRWKNIVMMVLAGITILVQVPTVLLLLAELVSMLF